MRFLVESWISLFSRLAYNLPVRGDLSSVLNSDRVKNRDFADADLAYGIVRLAEQRASAAPAGSWPWRHRPRSRPVGANAGDRLGRRP
ncbi:hypothetical protein BQ8482_90018 [Mesorhizobium delmotii]|uniref:Uncharacterized protein n=1 Tax=Mesorhizobium delmotii TaxID=1631247 RepID=A0A2P9AX05_9HYPH|nr:hypothetical protein BQ8482_90018 [Mesorhizobium delmotii]